MKTLADVQRYLDAHRLELRCRRSSPRRWHAKLLNYGGGVLTEWEQEADDLDGAVSSVIEAHRALTASRAVRS